VSAAVEFRALGPVDVLVDGRPLAIGRGKQRALLVLLVLNANRLVSSDRIIDELWGERPPATAQTALQVYVSRLRKALPAGVLTTRPPGYVLEVEPESIDLKRFERLTAAGRDELAAGRPEPAAAFLREALDLWHGPALADVAFEPFAQRDVVRLEDLRVAAIEDRIDAELALGCHAELVGELDALVGDHPLRERLRGQLMLALYRSGRQAEALDQYRRARQALVEELGIDPSAELQELERGILRQDEALAAPPRPVRAQRLPEPTPEPPAERKVVTVLFADLGIAAAADPDADPETVSDLLDRVFAAAADELESAGGAVERGVADAVLAVFGAATTDESHAESALDAALVLRDRLDAAFGELLAPRIGIETGEVVLRGALATGAPVGVAGRLLRGSQPGEIVVGERAAAAVSGSFELTGSPRRLVRRLVPAAQEAGSASD
jgi:DNA-binding SARP family transcriptional activator